MKTLIIVYSCHHMNTLKVAQVFAKVFDAQIKKPQEVTTEELKEYDLIGFGSGIYGEKHDQSLLDLADSLSPSADKKAFIFSTSAIMGKDKVAKDHLKLREKLHSKGYIILDEFACKGFNTNSFMKYLGGMNKGHPNADDLHQAEKFAQNIKESI